MYSTLDCSTESTRIKKQKNKLRVLIFLLARTHCVACVFPWNHSTWLFSALLVNLPLAEDKYLHTGH